MASQEDLKRAYPISSTIGNHFNERPKPDVFGRTDATPLEVERTINGLNHFPEQPVPQWELREQARRQRKQDAKKRRNHRNGVR